MKAINAQIDNHMSKLLDGDREFILDTGASFHLGCPSKLTNDERLSIHSVPSQQVQTANGTVSTNQMATVFVKILEIHVEVYLMDHCPWLLSIGMLCQQCDFVWRRGQNPLIGIYDQGMSDQPKFVELPVYANIPRCTVAKGNSLPSTAIGGDPVDVRTHSSSGSSSSPQPNANDAVKPPEVPSSPSGAPSGDTKPEASEAADECKWEKVRSKRSRRRKSVPTCKKANTLSDHNIFTHNPKHPSCPICTGAKMQNAQNRRSCKKAEVRTNEEKMPEATKLAHSITLDHIILAKEEDLSRTKDRVACILLDIHSKWLQSYQAKTNSSEETKKAIVRFLGPSSSGLLEPSYIYSDNSQEIATAIKELNYDDRHDTSTPNRPATNGLIERTEEGTAAAIHQAGAIPEWWADAMR